MNKNGIYSDYFSRLAQAPGFVADDYKCDIATPRSDRDISQFQQLLKDCFGHQVRWKNISTGENVKEIDDPKRRFLDDSVFEKFCEEYDKDPPTIYRCAAESDMRPELKIGESEFLLDVTSPAFDYRNVNLDEKNVGTNRISYLIGNPGQGKSLFVTNAMKRVNPLCDRDDRFVLPVYFSFQSRLNQEDGVLTDWTKDVMCQRLFRAIQESVINLDRSELKDMIAEFRFDHHNTIGSLIRLCHQLALIKTSLFLIFDNIDQYYFRFLRVSFISDYERVVDEGVRINISGLIGLLEQELSHTGISALIVCRSYVYHTHRMCSHYHEPLNDNSNVFRIEDPTLEQVIGRRWQVMGSLIENSPTIGKDWKEALSNLKISFELKGEGKFKRPSFKMIHAFSRKDFRTLVDFVGSLKPNYRETEFLERFLTADFSMPLVLLFILNSKLRFAQEEHHFPNMFLCDAVIKKDPDFPKASSEHTHTYWLKYFILAYVNDKGKVSVSELLSVFVGEGKYNEVLVRLIIGSLCTTDWYYCLEVDEDSITNASEARLLSVTSRGKSILDSIETFVPTLSQTNPFAFSFLYLQLVIDDPLLAIPNLCKEEFAYGSNYSYLLSPNYMVELTDQISEKATKVLIFWKVLREFLKAELNSKSESYISRISDFIPNVEITTDRLLQEINGVCQHTKLAENWVYNAWKVVDRELSTLQKAAEEVYEKEIKVF